MWCRYFVPSFFIAVLLHFVISFALDFFIVAAFLYFFIVSICRYLVLYVLCVSLLVRSSTLALLGSLGSSLCLYVCMCVALLF